MADSKVIRENFIALQGWMIRDLQLKGNELIIYACIYGFSQAENQVFSGSLQYLADWTNTTKQSALNCLKSLTEKGYIVKNEKVINGVKFCEYYAKNLNEVLKNFEYPIQKSLMGGIQKNLTNNISFDNTDNTIAKKKREKAPKENTHSLFDKLYPNYEFSEAIIAKMREWITYKVERKEDYQEQGLKSLLTQIKKKCAEYSEDAVCELIDDCMANNWKGIIFERLKGKENRPQSSNKSYNTDDFFEAALRRSYEDFGDKGKENPPKTAGNDPAVREKAEALIEKLKQGE